MVLAACARAQGDAGRAAIVLRLAIAELEAEDMQLYVVVARAALAMLGGGEDAGRAAAEANAWMKREGVIAPARFAGMIGPGLAPWPEA
jgi:hypothetical protein